MTSTDPQDQSAEDLIVRLERTLGIAVLVESVEHGRSGCVRRRSRRASCSGATRRRVAVTGPSEAKAWEELARAAIAWRNSDYQHIPMWPGGG